MEGLSYHLDEGSAQGKALVSCRLTRDPFGNTIQSCCRHNPCRPTINTHAAENGKYRFPAKWFNESSNDGHFEITFQ